MGKKSTSLMVRLMSKIKGFTMIEMLFVVNIITILSLLSFSFQKINTSSSMMVDEITRFLTLAKTYSVVYKEKVTIEIKNYEIICSSKHFNETLKLEKGKFKDHYTFHYNENGNIQTAKTLNYLYNNYNYSFVFQVGSGVFYVKEKRIDFS